MQCTVCDFHFCWVCGLRLDHWFHRIQVGDVATCGFVNLLMEVRNESKCLRLSCVYYPLASLAVTIGPVLFYAIFLVCMPIYFVLEEPFEVFYKMRVCTFRCTCVFYLPALAIGYGWCALKIIGCIILASLGLVTAYTSIVVLSFVGLGRFSLCKNPLRAANNRGRIEELLSHNNDLRGERVPYNLYNDHNWYGEETAPTNEAEIEQQISDD